MIVVPRDANSQESENPKFSPEVVAKAEGYLEEVQLRRSGKSIQSTKSTELSRALSALAKKQRDVRLVQQSWQNAEKQLAANRNLLQALNVQLGELNLQLARVAGGDVQANNRLVGLIEATRAQVQSALANRETLKNQLAEQRSKLTIAETAYAETVLAIRADYERLNSDVKSAIERKETQIALSVMSTNFDTPKELTSEVVLQSLDKRLKSFEKEIFREAIPLEVASSGALHTTVVVGTKPVRMIVDSGAALVTLPVKTALELGIEIPLEARSLKMVMADGRTIPAKSIVLPRVRIGQFEAKNVEAAVLDPIATDAEPLLGMSFLGHFKFEINANEKTISMLRVETE